jgi:hypothetical protein
MISSEKCPICGKRGKRPCPATGGLICPACCGSNRGSKLNCPPECGFFPFGVAGHGLLTEIDGNWISKTHRYLEAQLGEEEMSGIFDQFVSKHVRTQQEGLLGVFYPTLYHALLLRRDAEQKTLADRWEAEGWTGLNNDERTMMQFSRKSYVTVVEVQRLLDTGSLECVDFFEPEPKPFVIYRPKDSSPLPRFTRLLVWLTTFSDYSRISAGGFEVADLIWPAWVDFIQGETASQKTQRPELTVKQYLAENLSRATHAIHGLMEEAHKRVLESMDFHQCIATYNLSGSLAEVKAVLDNKPDFELDETSSAEKADPPKFAYAWLRKGESQEIEKSMPSMFRHAEGEGAGILGSVRLYDDRMEIETLSKQKYNFARSLVEKCFGTLLQFQRESIVDLAKQMAERDEIWPDETEETAPAQSSSQPFIPPEMHRNILLEAHKRHYTKLLDDPVPALDNKTPRAAAQEPAFRPKLIEWLKAHIRHIDLMNQRDGLSLDINWVLDELGVPELK